MIATCAHIVRSASIVEGRLLLTGGHFNAICAKSRVDAGAARPYPNAALLFARLAPRLRALHLAEFAAYCAILADPVRTKGWRQMLITLTTKVTRFFREPHRFDYLRRKIQPLVLRAAERGRRVCILRHRAPILADDAALCLGHSESPNSRAASGFRGNGITKRLMPAAAGCDAPIIIDQGSTRRLTSGRLQQQFEAASRKLT